MATDNGQTCTSIRVCARRQCDTNLQHMDKNLVRSPNRITSRETNRLITFTRDVTLILMSSPDVILLFYFCLFCFVFFQITKSTSVGVLTNFFGVLLCRSKIPSMFQNAVVTVVCETSGKQVNPLNPELNPICYLLTLLAHHFLHVSRIRVKSLTLR